MLKVSQNPLPISVKMRSTRKEKGMISVKNDGVTKEEIELLLSKQQTDSKHPLKIIKELFITRFKSDGKKKK
jgi:hypothetical protein